MTEITGILDIYGATGEPPRLVIYDMASLQEGDLIACMKPIEDGNRLRVFALNASDILFDDLISHEQQDPQESRLTDYRIGTLSVGVWSEWFTNNHRAVLTREK